MSLTIVPFDRARDLDVAAGLLAERHARDRERDPRFPAAFEVPGACRPIVEQALEQSLAYGVLAKDGDRTRGFAIMNASLIPQTHFLSSFFPLRGAAIGYGAHAVDEGMEYDVYRAMYGALAEHFVALGYYDHTFNFPARDAAAHEAFASLAFGRSMCAAMRGVDPPEREASAAVEVHLAAAEDAEVVFKLAEELMLHHAYAPIFNPFVREGEAAHHEMLRGLLQEPEKNAHWVAYEGSRPVGMNTFMPPSFLSVMTVPDKTVYLFQGIVTQDARAGGIGTALLARATEWAREQQYEHIGLHFATPNLQGAKFWQSSGFAPVEYGMRRRIDDRIAWANR